MTETLYVSKDRKVANQPNKAGIAPTMANAFGMASGTSFSCPNATSFCDGICYAGKIEKMYAKQVEQQKGVTFQMVRNFEVMLYADYLGGIPAMQSLIETMVSSFEAECEKRNAPKLFRIHWDGDFFSVDYAQAWVNVVKAHPDIQFWVYTRSFDTVNVIPTIAGIDNLTVYLSADPVNFRLAYKVAADYPDVNVALVGMTFAAARAIMDREGRKVYNCPENGKRIPLISAKGSACAACGICITGRGDVAFSVKKK